MDEERGNYESYSSVQWSSRQRLLSDDDHHYHPHRQEENDALINEDGTYDRELLSGSVHAAVDGGICLRDIVLSYGSNIVIDGLNMKVEKGTIYGLLGPSGCGKTTLLKTILGRLVPTQGSVWVLGEQPHHGSLVPGPAVGYAPQEIALYNDLTIEETLLFHSRIHMMDKDTFIKKKKWLLNLLQLPDEKRLVGNCSGGQQRRVSLAVALLHSPSLLILDEPTVGVDPVLRQRIWEYLREIASMGVTILITTHYIEEARQADKIGLMRNGRLLVEGSPTDVMDEFEQDTLEDVFLTLCKQDKRDESSDALFNLEANPAPPKPRRRQQPVRASVKPTEKMILPAPSVKPNNSRFKPVHQSVAFGIRKITQLRRNYRLLIFETITPMFQIMIFLIAVGPQLKNLPFGIYAEPQAACGAGHNWSDQLILNIQNQTSLQLTNYTDLNAAIADVKTNKIWGVLYIPSNFSCSLPIAGTLGLYIDLSNYQISLVIQTCISNAYQEVLGEFLDTHVNPVQVNAIYGSTSVRFSDFLAPGMIAIITFAHAIVMTAVSFVREKVDGSLDRIFATGVTPGTIIAGHFICAGLLLILQTTVMLLVAVLAFNILIVYDVGIIYVFILLVLLGFAGMSFGLVVSAISYQEAEALQLTIMIFFPSMLLSGILWPIEAIPSWFSWISYALPTAWTAQGLRSVMIRGWDLAEQDVWLAILVTAGWAVFLLIIANISLAFSGSAGIAFRIYRTIQASLRKRR